MSDLFLILLLLIILEMYGTSLPAFLASFSGVKSVVSTILRTVDDLKLSWDEDIETWGLIDKRVQANRSFQKEWDDNFTEE